MDKATFKKNLLEEVYSPFNAHKEQLTEKFQCVNIVFGEGDPDAALMFIGEAPGREEDEQGRPFVGRSGKLLTKILHDHHVKRSDVFITNIVKCRPPNNRTPLPPEVAFFYPLLLQEIKIVQPTVICTLGSSALSGLTEQKIPITKIRGKPQKIDSITLIPTLHPAYILRNPGALELLKKDIEVAWQLAQK